MFFVSWILPQGRLSEGTQEEPPAEALLAARQQSLRRGLLPSPRGEASLGSNPKREKISAPFRNFKVCFEKQGPTDRLL